LETHWTETCVKILTQKAYYKGEKYIASLNCHASYIGHVLEGQLI